MSDADWQRAKELLGSVYGFDSFRPGQAEILQAVLAGHDILALMPTGSGKSLCYQLPALVRKGLTIVVSPLIALMRDQVAQLRDNGVAAAAFNSSNTSSEDGAIAAQIRTRQLRLLYVAPERLVRADTQALLREGGADVMAIDEAHCVSQWGHDFRPEYRNLREWGELIGISQTIAVTATADPPTRADIAARLFARPPQQFLHSFDRPNLRLAMQRRHAGIGQIAQKMAEFKGESGIVYCASRKGVDTLAAQLRALGHWALPYHAGLESHVRTANQDEFLQNDGVVMVATIAFGMGIDKPDVRYVCHANLPASVEAYYQEIGRAGRDGLPADTLTLYNQADIQFRQRQIQESDAPVARRQIEARKLDALVALCETPRCRRQTLLAAFGEVSKPCGNCDICEGGFAMFNGRLLARKAMSAVLRTQGRFHPRHLANVLTGTVSEAISRHGHDLLPTFGVGKELSTQDWARIYAQLQAAGLIVQDVESGGGWALSALGLSVLREETELELRVLEHPAKKRDGAAARAILEALQDGASPAATGESAVPMTVSGARLTIAQAKLLAALKACRGEIARQQKIPAYVIFHDRTLIEMAVQAPRNVTEFAKVHGVGEAKVKAYGGRFLAIIAAHAA